MQGDKSPGPDGFFLDFLKVFSFQLSHLLLAVFEESFVSKSLPPTMRQAIISFLLKKEKIPLFVVHTALFLF